MSCGSQSTASLRAGPVLISCSQGGGRDERGILMPVTMETGVVCSITLYEYVPN